MPHRHRLFAAIACALCSSAPLHAATDADDDTTTLHAVEVSAALDTARNQLSPGVGASQYVFDTQAIEQLPLGDATPLNQILLQAPGVVQDSFGQLHIRGDHDDVQYRINGVTIPESISGFGQTLDPDLIERLQLLTGALPAQYGYRTAGVVEITTESGAHRHHDDDDDAEGDGAFGGRASVLGGSFGTFAPELSLHGSEGPWSFFLTAEFDRDDVGIENPTPARNAIHDRTEQTKTFGYVSYLLADDTRLSAMFGGADNRFQIPNVPGQVPAFALAGAPPVDSAALDERQREVTAFGVLSLQGKVGASDYQVSLGQRYSGVRYRPDAVGDLVFNGAAGTIVRSNRADTLQADVATPLAPGHTLRYGLFVSSEHPSSDSRVVTFPADAAGNATSDVPLTVVDIAPPLDARTYGLYVQDEWNASDRLTVNYGLRADAVRAYVDEGQLSPRLGLSYALSDATTLHAGYARYFTPPPAELIAPRDLALFRHTTNAPPSDASGAIRSERAHYFDLGVSQKIAQDLTLGLDAYYRTVHDLLDEGQFGQALIEAPFNYAQGRVRGVEFSANWKRDDFSAYLNLASSRALGKNVVSGQYDFPADELAYIAQHWVHLDHDQRLSGSGGVAYTWRGTTFGADFLYGSGLRRGFANTAHLPDYYQLNLSAARNATLPALGKVNLRLALINATDQVYELRDGSGIGVGAPQFGPRRGVYGVLSKAF